MINDNINMKEKDLLFANFVANLVVQKIEHKFELLRFKDMEDTEEDELSIDELLNDNFSFQDDKEEKLIAELARLITLLVMYEDKELYEKAAIIKNKIRIINKKLSNL